jgi:predicted dehydrogenase
MADRVRMAFIGVGRFSNNLAEGATRSSRIEIAACLSRTEGKMAAFTEKYGGVAKKTYEEVMGDDSIDAVVLSLPNSLHAPQTIEAARNGKHIYVEKPMALSVADCKKMIAASKEAGVILTVGHKWRKVARVRKAKELIDKGAVGAVILAEANLSRDRAMGYTPEMWQWYRKEMPGGPLCSHTVHEADNLNYLVGPVKRVVAFTSKVCGKAETDDVMSAALEFESGALGYLGGTNITPLRKYLQIHGIEGVVFVDNERGEAYYQKKGTSTLVKQEPLPDVPTQTKNACAEVLDEFAACIQGGGKPEPS